MKMLFLFLSFANTTKNEVLITYKNVKKEISSKGRMFLFEKCCNKAH